MLRELRIRDFAVIDQVSLELGPGLNVLTGETGAGKTIILNALGLLSGGRTSSDIIRHGEEEATVEALFEPLSRGLREKLREAGYADEEGLVIKRIVSRSGRNRIYLNGSLCPLGFLSEAGDALVRIYGQHEHHDLLRPESQLALLDAYAGLADRVGEMRERYRAFHAAWDRLRTAREARERRGREEELLRARTEEISRAALRAGEEDEIHAKRKILVHAERLCQVGKEGEELLYEGEAALLGQIERYAARLREMANVDGALNPTVELLDSASAQLEEAASALRRYTDRIEFNPQALEQLEDRLAEINRLKRKYNAPVEGILEVLEDARKELDALEHGTEEIGSLERAFEETRRSAWAFAEAISLERKRAARNLKKELEREVERLGMPQTTFGIRFPPGEKGPEDPPFLMGGKKITAEGTDQVELEFAPNPGESMKPLARIASGGELSRVMLAIKSLVLTRGDISTLLFDEVDSGIGGRIAEMVGKKLRKVAEAHQVICVTHLPQIAALAHSHFVVEKEVGKGRTSVAVKRLSDRERVGEVARMLGGIKVTEQARRHAEEMIKVHASGRMD